MNQPADDRQDAHARKSVLLNASGFEWNPLAFAQLELDAHRVRTLISQIEDLDHLIAERPNLLQMTYAAQVAFFPGDAYQERLPPGEGERLQAMRDLATREEGRWSVLSLGFSDYWAVDTREEKAVVDCGSGGITWTAHLPGPQAQAKTYSMHWGHLQALLCCLVPDDEFEPEFRRLVARVPVQAVQLLERGLGPHDLPPEAQRPLPPLSREAVSGLLTHKDGRLRERAIAALGELHLVDEGPDPPRNRPSLS